MNFVIAAGGTGGHLFPGLAVGEVMRARGHEVMILISEKEIDALATQGRSEFRIEKLPGIGMPKLLSPAIFPFLRRFKAGLDQCRAHYAEFKPDAVLGMGGFTSTAPILAGRRRKIPTFVHESNAIPGEANRLNARLVTAVLLGFAECGKYFRKRRWIVTGTPIRDSLATRMDKGTALAAFDLVPGRKTLFVMGGSQGAQGINRALLAALPLLKDASVQVIHLTGRQDEETMRTAYAEAGVPAFVAAFSQRMAEGYSAADFCIARSGAASLTELSHFALPSVLIPYPFAAEDHQTLNANIFAQAGAATLLNEREITGEILAKTVRSVLENPGRLSEMSARCASLATQEAAVRVADTILKFCA
jgi:UDP-N-acetylglucosamine--N-acetylmuramyl-(pentapeptide) pyrophosphoryl-undecaprenol N-acetylglucosamine transferase